MSRKGAGFTLVEVLVALAIVAIALLAALRSAGQGIDQTAEQRARLLAGWVGENRLAEHRVRGDWLPLGSTEGSEVQAALVFVWREDVQATPHPAFRRVELTVFATSDPEHILAHFTGFSVNPPRPAP